MWFHTNRERILANKENKYIDYGGGFGIFTRLMRDIGFDFYWYDPYTKNEVANCFEANLNEKYDVLTIFEGFEHFTHPQEDLEKMLQLADTIIFSTTLVPKETPNTNNWWYYWFEHGQHIALYSKESLISLAKNNCCNF